METPRNQESSASASFATTNWTMVIAARERGSVEAEEALAALCHLYWYPLFAFARRQGYDAVQAQDWTQAFFEALLEKDSLKNVDRSQGRFRSFLLAAFRHFIANQQRAARAQKRGGERRTLSIDFREGEERYSREPFHEENAEQLFERQWAVTLLEQVLLTLKFEQQQAGKSDVYNKLKVFLGGSTDLTYNEAGKRLGMSEGAVKMAVHRLRQRFGELLRLEIARTVTTADEVEEEIRGLFTSLSR